MRMLRLVLFGLFASMSASISVAQELTLTRGEITVHYEEPVPLAAAEMVAARAEAGFAIVRAFLAQAQTYAGEPYSAAIEIIIDPEQFAPYQRGATIRLPQTRVLNIHNGNTEERTDIGMIHEITHVLAASFNRSNHDRFYDDGLAVYLQHRFGEEPNYPNFSEDLYVATVKFAARHGGFIPLAETEATRRAAETRTSRRLAYLQEGAFTQFLIENYGLNAYFRIYHGEDLETVTNKSLDELESDWLTVLTAIKL